MLVQHKTVLLDRHRAAWVRLLLGKKLSRDDAEDLVQDLALRILLEPGPRFSGAFWSYWTRALLQMVAVRYRQPVSTSLTFQDGSEDEPCDPNAVDPANAVWVGELCLQVQAALAAIRANDPVTGDILTRYYLKDQSVSEIATAHQKSREAVKARLFEGRKRLRRLLTALAPA